MMEAIGQDFDGARGVVFNDRPEDRNLSYPERRALRELRLRPASNEAAKRLYAAEDARDMAREALRTAAVNLLLGETDEPSVRAVEDQIADAEREVRRWTAAARQLDDERGVIRDSAGNILR